MTASIRRRAPLATLLAALALSHCVPATTQDSTPPADENPPPQEGQQPPGDDPGSGDPASPGPFQITAPLALVTITTASTDVEVAWTTASDAVDYALTLATDAACANVVEQQTATGSPASFTSVPAADYFLCVRAHNATGTADATNQPYPFSVVFSQQPPTPKSNGTACANDAECSSASCTDGVCCETECADLCASCLGAHTGGSDGQCLPVSPGLDPANECETTACGSGTCDGAGACALEPNTTVCRAASGGCDLAELCDGSSALCGADLFATEGTVCGGYFCAGGTAACPTTCTSDADCATDHFCADDACVSGKRFFVSSARPSGALGGLDGADSVCQGLALAAGRGGTYKAFLGTSASSAAARLTHASIPYRTVTGTIIADDWDDLTDGSLDAQPIVDETGITISFSFAVWTGSDESGAYAANGDTNCNEWTTDDSSEYAVVGFANNATWADAATGQCDGTRRLYCLEQ